jgi:23S rRNA (uracil1939-C5)-methyltransferase
VAERLTISRVGPFGDGICDTPAGAIYVAYALPGESVEVRQWQGHPDRRHLIAVETASPDRIAPVCPHFGICGGCALQHWAPEAYRQWKRALVDDALARVGLRAATDDFIDAWGGAAPCRLSRAARAHDLSRSGLPRADPTRS